MTLEDIQESKLKYRAQDICSNIDTFVFAATGGGSLKWNAIYQDEESLINDLKLVVIPKSGVPYPYTYKGYEYIHSFAKRVQSGGSLSEAQMKQAKRLAIEIYKAARIADCGGTN